MSNESDNTDEQVEPLKEYYVYALFDKANNKVFYVGKGKGQRCFHHEREADRSDLETEKIEMIRKLKARDSLGVIILSRHDSQVEAYAVESVLIKWVYGKDNLTNQKYGEKSDYVRSYDNFKSGQARLDVGSTKSDEGVFTEEKINDLRRYNTYEFRDQLRGSVEAAGFETYDFKDSFEAFDPLEGNGYLGFVVKVSDLDLRVDFTKSKKISIKILPTKSISQKIELKLSQIGYGVGEFVNMGRYAHFTVAGQEMRKFATKEEATKFLEIIQNTLANKVAA